VKIPFGQHGLGVGDAGEIVAVKDVAKVVAVADMTDEDDDNPDAHNGPLYFVIKFPRAFDPEPPEKAPAQ
jgi:hypothetical protein